MEEGNLMSHGSIIKEEGRVLQELADNLKKPSNVSCRIEKFGNVVEGFCVVKRKWVCEMGFEGLLNLAGCRLPRSLCYWLATRVNWKDKEMISVDGRKFPLSKVQIHWVYGLPYGPKAVPNHVKGKRMKAVEKEVWEQFGTTTPCGTMCISGQSIVDTIDKSPDDEIYFKRAFLMLALNEILCPTTCYRLSIKLIPAVTVSRRANKYDWCSLVLDHLLFYLARFAKQFDLKGYVAGCAGCTHFLAVFYLDKLKRAPLCWGVYPRVKVWNNKEVNKALAEDRVPRGDYGRLGCIDVAYGEPHPQEARDLFPQARPVVLSPPTVEDRVAHKYYTVHQRVYRKKKRNKATNGNSYARKMNKRKGEASGVSETNRAARRHSKELRRHSKEPLDADVALESEDVWKRAIFSSGKERSSTPRRTTPTLSTTPCENEEPPEEVGNTSADEGSPISAHVNDVMQGIFGEHGDHAVTDDKIAITPQYQWGSMVLSPCKRRIEIDQFEVSGDKVSIDSTQLTYISHETSESEGDAFIEIHLSPPPGFDTGGLMNGSNRVVSPLAGVHTPTAEMEQCTGAAQEGTSTSSPRTLVQRVTKAPQKFSPHYIKAWRSSAESRMKIKLARVVLKCLQSMEDDPVLFECDGWSAHLSSVSALMLPTGFVDVKYVSTAAKLNSKVWSDKSMGRSKKIMFTPHSAIDALESTLVSDNIEAICERHVHQLASCEARKINGIFVPVVQRRIWWAVAFSLNRREIRVMDPSGLMTESIEAALPILKSMLKKLLGHVFPSWGIPDLTSWAVVASEFYQRSDELGSGVTMLMAFKSCEDRFSSTLTGRLDFKQRAWLLAEDLMSPHNVARDTCKALVKGGAS